MSADGPNPLKVAVTVVRSLLKKRPKPSGDDAPPATSDLSTVLEKLRSSGVSGLPSVKGEIEAYRRLAESVDPDRLDRNDALAFWLNLYNAGALELAARAARSGETSVLRVPGGFNKPFVVIAGEKLSLSDIENGKIRRFRDPRIHGALVCGSASCPTLRYEPYRGHDIDEQLDHQLRSFFAGGGAAVVRSDNDTTVLLSRVLLWYGNDFVRPRRMPVFLPATKRAVAKAVRPWLPDDALRSLDEGANVGFQPYDWSLACSIG